MRIRCDRCKQAILVPDEWAGRRVRCLGCNKVLLVPYPDEAGEGPDDSASPAIDLTELASPSILQDEDQLYFPDISRQVVAKKKSPEGAALQRVCPKCGRTTSAPDPYSEVLCSHCWTAIPAAVAPRAPTVAAKDASKEIFRLMNLGFVRTIPLAFGFAVRAWTALLPGMLLSLLALAAPLIVLIAVAMTTGEHADLESAELNLPYARPTLLIVMGLQLAYFLLVGFMGIVQNVGVSVGAGDRPVLLSWNLQGGAKSLAPLMAMIGVYALLIVLMALLCGVIPSGWYRSLSWLHPLEWPAGFWIALTLVLLLLPMSLIGLASRNWLTGVNPVNVVRSVVRTIGPYLVLVFLILAVIVFVWAVLAWAGGLVLGSLVVGQSEGLSALLGELCLALPVWAVSIGLGFLGTYLIARWLGLFALNYRNRLVLTL